MMATAKNTAKMTARRKLSPYLIFFILFFSLNRLQVSVNIVEEAELTRPVYVPVGDIKRVPVEAEDVEKKTLYLPGRLNCRGV
jgi:hypothetical protein